ncbi:hypothetical protein LY76DRAFT_607939 [Colletotrichum caudatum]|nr:hypothetical protein LY76DRAFT_607939 [Colletotrichum caudatum]
MRVANPRPKPSCHPFAGKHVVPFGESKLRSRTCRARPGSVMPSLHSITTGKRLSSSDSLDRVAKPTTPPSRTSGGAIPLDRDGTQQPSPAMDDQLATGFLGKLPREVRELIYSEALARGRPGPARHPYAGRDRPGTSGRCRPGCDRWKYEEARGEREIWRGIARGRTGGSVRFETWTAFPPHDVDP